MPKHETPRDPDGAKLCAWCGGPIQQSGVGRSKDYCSRTHKEYAYRARRDARLIAEAYGQGRSEALADDTRRVSTTAESAEPVTAVVETGSVQVPAPAEAGDFLLAPPEVRAHPSPQESPVLPDARKAPAPRRKLSRNRSALSAEAVPLWPTEEFGPGDANGE